MVLKWLLLAGSAQAAFNYRKVMFGAVKAPPVISVRDLGATAVDPCEIISKAFDAVPKNMTSTKPIILDLRPSVASACRKSVPLQSERNLALLEFLQPYVEYHSTIELLKSPPPEYLTPGVDIIGGMDAMRQKLRNKGYQSQVDVMTDLHSLFVAANDDHFGYTPGIFAPFRQFREGLDVVSISSDGRALPEIFAAQDIFESGNDTSNPSPIATINGQDVYEFLENDSMRVPQSSHDPDARLNGLFRSLAFEAAKSPAGSLAVLFDIPDNYTIVHKNGTSRVVTNSITTLPSVNLSNIRSGQDLQNRFEIPSQQNETAPPPPQTSESPVAPPAPEPTIPGYPLPLVKHPGDNVASFALNDTELRNTTVISFFSFVDLNSDDPLGPNFDLNGFVRGFGDLIDRTAKVAKEQGRDKLIIDMSANSGGSLDLADFAYTALFPGAKFDAFDRFRMSKGLEFTGRVLSYNASLDILVASVGLPTDPNNKAIESREAFFEPKMVKGQKMTAAFHRDVTVPYLPEPDLFLRGYEPSTAGNTSKREPPWKPENIVIMTDGLCASACSIFTGLLVRNFGIRTIALGGRPMNKPMQAIGGVRGSEILSNSNIKRASTFSLQEAKNSPDGQKLLQEFGKSLPSIEDPPLLPFMESPEGGSVNFRNAHSGDDPEGFPLHFKYQAANCKLFYTRKMAVDVTESWRQVAKIAFRNGTCVPGSTVNSDGTMGAKAPGFDPSVRARVPGIPVPTV
ncbi:peptidase s41 family protein [Pochonia chlamydosporia 170]|uniref:Peptidase s41 family protein n=1 Tax=Pochonia chlamydosporia 170 TaxID=1380566 RepID=A0A179G2E9_METCM|nr:peptidase s41 family protein [Pochonia chlamydosporia 170]OAQ72032.1 peptidase s41 family protein [Pochonia chlamydosporia 170]